MKVPQDFGTKAARSREALAKAAKEAKDILGTTEDGPTPK